MWTTPEPALAIKGVAVETLRKLASAFRAGQLAFPLTPFSLSSVECPPALALDLQRLSSESMSSAHLALLLDIAAEAAEARMQRDSAAQLVWSGPEPLNARSRDTSVVVEELFSLAERSVLVSTFVIHQADRVFRRLGERMDTLPALHVQVFLNIERRAGDTRLETGLLNEYSAALASKWPGRRRPDVYYDPRALSASDSVRASWHAKCVIVDNDRAFVTSANFTEWAQQRNVEAGVLVRSPLFAGQLRQQFEGLIASRQVRRLAGF